MAGATMTTTAVVVVAAGRGTRVEASTGGSASARPKQYRLLAGRPVLSHSLAVLSRHPAITAVVVVRHPDDHALYEEAAAPYADKLVAPVAGGATRQASVLAGLEALTALPGGAPDRVLIHDAARPFLSATLIDDLIAALDASPGAIAAEPVADTLKRADANGRIAATVDRSALWRAQTPQGFHFDAIRDAHRKAADANRHDFTDDAALAEWVGLPVQLVASSGTNMKLTTAADMDLAERILGAATAWETRVGSGFDVHSVAEGDHVWLCGVKIPHTHRLDGHSDADVGLHALTDALLGAIGDGDIGYHFPPSDEQWRGAASRIFLAHAVDLVRLRGGRITNVDVTLLCEAPKVGPHRPEMSATIAEILGIGPDRVGIKATTMERLGFIGRGEGIAAMASATVQLPTAAS
ncbi:2-C-methyl-D-erythritol 4-phosphate cytidylyltransferase [Hyphomicrobium sulfonivorans]|uniref:Bifunctional enzyme IspD/IspF n=2 Tax=Hyphomicrobium sulfonivorans TaxID=121290 RepID=A0A109BMR4_HYPSL|nr:2-C-methyl-D-erythritol 4-phosphate cytidylyltransferase [Hyphomicrobium sulfonivorans]